MRHMQTSAAHRRSSNERVPQAQSGPVFRTKGGATGDAAMLLSLQGSHGNRYVQRMLEATVLQRKCGCGGTCSHCSPAPSSSPPVVHEALSSSGQPLDASARAFMERSFGRDFQSVRIHTGAKASESAKAVNALAYTVGQDIVFAEGHYNPASYEGRRLLAHELAHTVQQAGAGPGPISGMSQPGDASEREADQAAESVMRAPDPAFFVAGWNGAGPRVVRLQRKCGHCAAEENDEARTAAVRCPGIEGEEGDLVHREMPPVRPPGEAEEEPLSPGLVSPGIIQRANARVLQRWTVNGRASPARNTIVCDGSGGIRVQVSNANDATGFGCVGDCVLRHEESHKADALAANAKVCDGSADASQLNFSAGEQKPSEIKASQVEIDCLNAKKPSASATCKPYVEARITQMIAYRDSFK